MASLQLGENELIALMSRFMTDGLSAKLSNPYTVHNFPNQLVSRQRRKAIRARCSITHKLFSEMSNNAQISLLSTPSTSRILKTTATFLGNLSEHSRYVFQKTSLSRLSP